MTAVKIRSDGWPAVSSADAYGLGTAPAKVYRFGETDAVRQRRAEIEAAISDVQAKLAAKRAKQQVTGLCGHSSIPKEEKPTQSRYQRRHPVSPGSAEALAKLAIETGRRHPETGKLLPPLEPWTCPVPMTGMLAYARIIKGSDGADQLSSYAGDRLRALNWMRQEQLVRVENGRVLPLSDMDRAERRTYPGALISDEEVKRTRSCYLGERGEGLIMAAVLNLRNRDTPRRALHTRGGLALACYQIAEEVNRIISTRLELDGFRYMSVETCRRMIKGYDGPERKDGTRKHYPGLIERGMLTELEPPKAVRKGRTWHTLPRVLGLEIGGSEYTEEFILRWCGTGSWVREGVRRHKATAEEIAVFGLAPTIAEAAS